MTQQNNGSSSTFDDISSLHKLLLVQFIHKNGDEAFDLTSKELAAHPLLHADGTFLSTEKNVPILSEEQCHALYLELLKSHDLPRQESTSKKVSPSVEKLTNIYYQEYQSQLIELIKQDEERFKRRLNEIEEINEGKWDDRLVQKNKLKESPSPQDISEKVKETHEGDVEQPSTEIKSTPPSTETKQKDTHILDESPEERQRQEPDAEGQALLDSRKEDHEEEAQEQQEEEKEIKQDAIDKPQESPSLQETTQEAQPEEGPSLQEKEQPSDKEAEEEKEEKEEEEEDEEQEDEDEDGDHEPLTEDHSQYQLRRSTRKRGKKNDNESPSPSTETANKSKISPRRGRKRKATGDIIEAASSPVSGGSTPHQQAAGQQGQGNKRFQAMVAPLLSNISSMRSASFFSQPVNSNDAPNYFELILDPTDLRTIKSQVKDGRINSTSQLERELNKMFANAIMYNRWDSEFAEYTREMHAEVELLLHAFRDTESRTIATAAVATNSTPSNNQPYSDLSPSPHESSINANKRRKKQ